MASAAERAATSLLIKKRSSFASSIIKKKKDYKKVVELDLQNKYLLKLKNHYALKDEIKPIEDIEMEKYEVLYGYRLQMSQRKFAQIAKQKKEEKDGIVNSENESHS
jgi:hypothetical protein